MRSAASIRSELQGWLRELRTATAPALKREDDAEIEAIRSGPTWARLEYFLRDEKGERIHLAEIHKSWIDFIERAHASGYHAGILAPFEHGKTAVCVVGLALDAIGKNKNIRIQIVCNADDNAIARVASIKQYIESSEAYHRLYPHIRAGKKWQVESITVERDSFDANATVQAYGVTSRGTSSRSDLTFFDDVDDIESLSADVRNARQLRVENVWLQRVGRGKAIAVATAWHEEDFAHQAAHNPRWAWMAQGVSKGNERIRGARVIGGRADSHAPEAVPDEADSKATSLIDRMIRESGCPELSWPLWADRWPKDALDAAEKLAPRAHARGRRQEAYSEAEKWFPSFERCVHYGVSVERLNFRAWRHVIGVDLSSKKRKGNAIVDVGQHPDGRKVISGVEIGAWTSYDTSKHIATTDGFFLPEAIFVESVALQEAIIEWTVATKGAGMGARPDWWTRLKGYETKGNVHTDEEQGIRALEIEFSTGGWVMLVPHEKGEVVVPREKAPGCGCGPCELVRQVTQHPHGKDRDALMAMWFAREGFRTLGAKMQFINRNESRAGARDHRAL